MKNQRITFTIKFKVVLMDSMKYVFVKDLKNQNMRLNMNSYYITMNYFPGITDKLINAILIEPLWPISIESIMKSELIMEILIKFMTVKNMEAEISLQRYFDKFMIMAMTFLND